MKAITSFISAGFNHCENGLIGLFYHGQPIKCNLVAEPENRYDQFAIRLECMGNKIGYVPRGYVIDRARSVPGNYNQFVFQCLQAGMKFEAIAFARLQMRSDVDGVFHRFDNIYEYSPIVMIFPSNFDFTSNGIIPLDGIENIEDIRKRTTFKHIVQIDYKDADGKFWRKGNLYYNEYSDSFCVWNGREDISFGGKSLADIEIFEEDQNAREATKSAFLFIKRAKVNDSSIRYKNTILQFGEDRGQLYNKFLERFEK